MRNLNHLNMHREALYGVMGDGYNGAFRIKRKGIEFVIIASNGGGWEHVSISTAFRCPIWEEMNYFKKMFFHDDEVVMQLHPEKKNYVNHHPFCLHLWKPIGVKIPVPPTYMIGPKGT